MKFIHSSDLKILYFGTKFIQLSIGCSTVFETDIPHASLVLAFGSSVYIRFRINFSDLFDLAVAELERNLCQFQKNALLWAHFREICKYYNTGKFVPRNVLFLSRKILGIEVELLTIRIIQSVGNPDPYRKSIRLKIY